MANWGQIWVLSYFEGTPNVHCYTSCTLTTLHCRKVSFFQCCHMKGYNKNKNECEGCTLFCDILCIYIYIYILLFIFFRNFYSSYYSSYY